MFQQLMMFVTQFLHKVGYACGDFDNFEVRAYGNLNTIFVFKSLSLLLRIFYYTIRWRLQPCLYFAVELKEDPIGFYLWP